MFFSKISRQSVFKNLVVLTASNILLQMMGFTYRIFLSRTAGAEAMGVWHLITPFYSLISSLTLTGLTVAVAKCAASRHAMGDHIAARKSVFLAFRIFSLLVIITATLTFIFRDFISRDFLGDARTLPSMPLLFVCLFLTGFENILKNYFYGVEKVSPQITSELSEQVIRFLAVAVLFHTFGAKSPATSSLLIVCGMVISELSSVFLLHIFFGFEKKRFSETLSKKVSARELLSVSTPVSVSHGINNLLAVLNSALIPQRLVASGLSHSAATKSFGIMFGMTMPLLSFPIAFIASITSVILPRMSEARTRADFSDMRRKAAKAIHATGICAMPLMAIMIPLAPKLGELFFSQRCDDSLILPLCIATLISYYELALASLLNAIGKQTVSAVYIIIGGTVQLFFTWAVGIEGVGLSAFAIGSIVSGGITAGLQFLCLCRELSLSPRFSNWFLSPLLSSTLAALLTRIVFLSSSSLIFSAAVGLFSYGVCLTLLGTNPIRYIKTLIPKGE